MVQYKLQLRLHEHPSSRVLHLPADVDSYVFSGMYVILFVQSFVHSFVLILFEDY